MSKASNNLAMALATFMEEASELLLQMETILLRAEESVSEEDDLNALFRCAHTIKGSGGLFGLNEVERFTHVVENVLDRLRSATIHLEKDLISLLLESQDHFANLIAAVVENAEVPIARSDQLLVLLRATLGEEGRAVMPAEPRDVQPLQPSQPMVATRAPAVVAKRWQFKELPA